MAHIRSITATQSSTATSVVVLADAVDAGHTLLIGVCWEATAGTVPTISSVVDSRGNTYTTSMDASTVVGTTLAVGIIRGRIVTALQAGDTITITLSAARTRWCVQVDEFDDLASSPLDKTSSNAPGSSASLSTGTTAATTQPSELLYAVYGFGIGRTVTLGAGWSGGAVVETSAGSADRALQTAWKYVEETGTQQGTATLSSASTYAAVLGTYKTTAAVTADVSQVKVEAPLPGVAPTADISQVKVEVPKAVTGTVDIAQVRLTVPTRPGQPPYSGIKAARDGNLWDATISAAVDGAV